MMKSPQSVDRGSWSAFRDHRIRSLWRAHNGRINGKLVFGHHTARDWVSIVITSIDNGS